VRKLNLDIPPSAAMRSLHKREETFKLKSHVSEEICESIYAGTTVIEGRGIPERKK